MIDYVLVALAVATIGILVADIALRRNERASADDAQARADAFERSLYDMQANLERLGSSVMALSNALATESALNRQRHDMLVRQIETTVQTHEGLRREVTAQLEQSRRTLDERLDKVAGSTEERLNEVRTTMDRQLTGIRTDTVAQLDRMRTTVDEKLQKTLNTRITQSFSLVNERLREVDQGLGEMKSLAQDVGGLKRVLSNVKTRGIVGEVQLGAILQDILAPSQYDTNVAAVPGSSERVEFAVKLPSDDGDVVYLPIDSKFPGDTYEHLRDAQDAGDAEAVEAAWKTLEGRLRDEARDIRTKYIAPPATTTFGIMFLPFEGLYAEVANRPGLIERLQRSFNVNIAGPSTMAALLNSLQMGFQTVAIQRRANEIQDVLAAVKTEFATYQKLLQRAQKQLGTASKTIDSLAGTRSRAMERKLRDITMLDSLEAADAVLGIDAAPDGADGDLQILEDEGATEGSDA